jgi:DNA-binding NarL/FixJ family response regulator
LVDSVTVNPDKLELLWMQLEDAKLEVDFVHSHVQGVTEDKVAGAVSSSDSNYAYGRGLKAEETAIKNHLVALQEFKAALELEEPPQLESGVKKPPRHVDTALSPRERQVLALIASGKSSREIAAHLGIAFRTAVCHRYHIQTKLKAHKTADLTRAAMRMGLIEL